MFWLKKLWQFRSRLSAQLEPRLKWRRLWLRINKLLMSLRLWMRCPWHHLHVWLNDGSSLGLNLVDKLSWKRRSTLLRSLQRDWRHLFLQFRDPCKPSSQNRIDLCRMRQFVWRYRPKRLYDLRLAKNLPKAKIFPYGGRWAYCIWAYMWENHAINIISDMIWFGIYNPCVNQKKIKFKYPVFLV